MKVIFLILALINLVSCDNKQNTAQENAKPKEIQSTVEKKEPKTTPLETKINNIISTASKKYKVNKGGFYDYPTAPKNCKSLNNYAETTLLIPTEKTVHFTRTGEIGTGAEDLGTSIKTYKFGAYSMTTESVADISYDLNLPKISYQAAFEICKACGSRKYANETFENFKKNNYYFHQSRITEEGMDESDTLNITEKNGVKKLYCTYSLSM